MSFPQTKNDTKEAIRHSLKSAETFYQSFKHSLALRHYTRALKLFIHLQHTWIPHHHYKNVLTKIACLQWFVHEYKRWIKLMDGLKQGRVYVKRAVQVDQIVVVGLNVSANHDSPSRSAGAGGKVRECIALYRNALESFDRVCKGCDDSDEKNRWDRKDDEDWLEWDDVGRRGNENNNVGVKGIEKVCNTWRKAVIERIELLEAYGKIWEEWQQDNIHAVRGDTILRNAEHIDKEGCQDCDVILLEEALDTYRKALKVYEKHWDILVEQRKKSGLAALGRGRKDKKKIAEKRAVLESVLETVGHRITVLEEWLKQYGSRVCIDKAEKLREEALIAEGKIKELYSIKRDRTGDENIFGETQKTHIRGDVYSEESPNEPFNETAWQKYASAVRYYDHASRFESDEKAKTMLHSSREECCDRFDSQDERRLTFIKSSYHRKG